MRTFEKVFHTHPSVAIAVGWDRSRYLQLGRASWNFKREFLDVHITYRRLDDEEVHPLGVVSAATSDTQLLQIFADQYESHTPGDFVVIGGRLLTVTIDRGIA